MRDNNQEVKTEEPRCTGSEYSDLLSDNYLTNPVETYLSPELLHRCVAEKRTIAEAVANGERIVSESDEGIVEAYYWQGNIYVVSIEVNSEDGT